MASDLPSPVEQALAAFALPGECLGVRPFERGHIHDTFLSTWLGGSGEERYLHQRINETVFRDVEALMGNIERVTSHLAARAEPGERTLTLVPTRDGASYARIEGRAWRTWRFLEGTRALEGRPSPEEAFDAARAVGRFQVRLGDLPAQELAETIPHFFDTPHRFVEFDRARELDRAGRLRDCAGEFAFVEARRHLASAFAARLEDGTIPWRVIHGDAKLDNILFDARSGRAVCLVDLDTCMPGFCLYDYGDLVRSAAGTADEDERDLARVAIDPAIRTALTRGYLEGAADLLGEGERELLPIAERLVTLTIGLRFLTDHLNGDTYFKTAREGHNLDRARVQFRMVELLEEAD